MDLGEALKETLRGVVREVVREELVALDLNRAPEGDRLLTMKEAADLLGMSRDWLYRNAYRLPFVRRPADGSVRCSKQGIQKWLKTR